MRIALLVSAACLSLASTAVAQRRSAEPPSAENAELAAAHQDLGKTLADLRLGYQAADPAGRKKIARTMLDIDRELHDKYLGKMSDDMVFMSVGLLLEAMQGAVMERRLDAEVVAKEFRSVSKKVAPVIPAEAVAGLKNKASEERCAQAAAEFRRALSYYASQHKGAFPANADEIKADTKYFMTPKAAPPGHAESNEVRLVTGVSTMAQLLARVDDAGGWLYVGEPTSPLSGTLVLNCSHKDSTGRSFSDY